MKKKISVIFLVTTMMILGVIKTAYADGHRPPIFPICGGANVWSEIDVTEIQDAR